MDIVDRIELKIKQKNLTLKALEREIGIGNGTIKRWKESSPQCNKILLVANYLQVSLDWLITGNEKKELNENEIELLRNFSYLPEREQIKIIGKIEMIAEKYKTEKSQPERSSSSRTG